MDEATERRAEAAYARFQRTRSPQALAEVFDLIATELLLFARRFAGGATQAEDLVQQTFVRLIEQAERFDPTRRLLPWSMTILTNEARQIRRRGEPDQDRLPHREVPEPPAEIARRETQRALDAALADLPSDHRDVIALRHLHGLPPRRIAAELAIPVGIVKSRLRHGVRRLAASLPPGLAFATAMSLLAGRGLAATRRTLLVQVGVSTTYLPLWGWITMKKTLLVVGAAALIALATLSLAPDGLLPATDPAAAPVAANALEAPRDPAPANPSPSSARTNAESALATSSTTSPTAEAVGIDVRVRAIWQVSRRAAANVPLQLSVNGMPIAHGWTDPNGTAQFALAVPTWHWPDGSQVTPGGPRPLGIQTPLGSVRGFPVMAGTEPTTLEIELDDGQRVVGTVLDPSGNPVADAEVRLVAAPRIDQAMLVARSDAGGGFVLQGLPVGFELDASAGTRSSAPATIRDLTDGDRLVLRLDRGGDQLQLHVVAADRPVVGATVRVELAWVRGRPNYRRSLHGVTTAGGMVTFHGLPAGRHDVAVVHATLPPARRELQVQGDGSTRIETIELGATARLDGIVRRSGRPLFGVTVMIDEADSLLHTTLYTDRDGRFTAESLAVGKYRMFFLTGNTTASRQLELRAGEQTIAIDLPGGIAINGRLLLPDGSPAVGWEIAASRVDTSGQRAHTVTSADGTFALEEQAQAHYRLRANGPDGGEHEFVVLRTDGQPADYHLPGAALWQPASIVGRLEPPLDGAVFRLEHVRGANGPGSRAYENVAAGGTFGAGPLAPGRFRAWLEHDDEVRWLTELDLASGERKDLGVVTLPRCGTLTVALRHTDGIDTSTAVPQLRSALLTDGYALGPRLLPASDGRWHAARVPTGSWWVVVRGNGVAPELREVFIAPDAPHHVEIPVTPAVEVVLQLEAGGADAEEVGVRRETVRRSSDRVVVHHQEGMGPLRTERELAPGSYTIEISTAGGFHGLATFVVPSPVPIVVTLARR